MDKKLLISYEASLISLKTCMDECRHALGGVTGEFDRGGIADFARIEKAKISLELLGEVIEQCGEQHLALTGEELDISSYEKALEELETLKAIKLRETAEEFLLFGSKDVSLGEPLADAKEMLEVLLASGDEMSEEDTLTLANYALFVDKYTQIDELSSKERYKLMQTLSPLMGEDLVIGAFMDRSLTTGRPAAPAEGAPVAPGIPGTPDISVAPGVPGAPVAPDISVAPGVPGAPVTPVIPVAPVEISAHKPVPTPGEGARIEIKDLDEEAEGSEDFFNEEAEGSEDFFNEEAKGSEDFFDEAEEEADTKEETGEAEAETGDKAEEKAEAKDKTEADASETEDFFDDEFFDETDSEDEEDKEDEEEEFFFEE